MFTIGDFARHGRVSVRMLRHYDAVGLLRPARVDPASGRRRDCGRRRADACPSGRAARVSRWVSVIEAVEPVRPPARPAPG